MATTAAGAAATSLRLVYDYDEEPHAGWKEAIAEFPNHVPRFESKQACLEWLQAHARPQQQARRVGAAGTGAEAEAEAEEEEQEDDDDDGEDEAEGGKGQRRRKGKKQKQQQVPVLRVGSNPMEPTLQHSVSMFTTWAQIEKYVIPVMRRWEAEDEPYEDDGDEFYDDEEDEEGAGPVDGEGAGEEPQSELESVLENNRFFAAEDEYSERVADYLRSRLNLSLHRTLTCESTMNTLRYLFHHMRCGILVMIRQGRVVLFAPFVHKEYTNTWGEQLRMEFEDVFSYYSEKVRATNYREENVLQDKRRWWANGNIICNEHTAPGQTVSQYWGDQFLLQLRDMFNELCRERQVPDCDFFINKRDYPQVKYNRARGAAVEPYGFIYDKDDRDPEQDVPLKGEHRYPSMAPVLSFYTSERFADIPIPPSEDWEAATGEVFPTSFCYRLDYHTKKIEWDSPRDLFTEANFIKFQKPWAEKVNTAFFRGSATGGGVTAETNQRVHLAVLDAQWNADGGTGAGAGAGAGTGGLGQPPLLDAKLTKWNYRDKKIASAPMTFVKPNSFADALRVGKQNFTPIYEQSTFKYLIYVEGHCAACRYGFLMRLGSVILKVDSLCVADQMWYFPLLRPYVDHVPVKADLSDLREQIEWCRAHDDQCREIASNAKMLYDRFVARDGILDYLQLLCWEIASRRRIAPEWYQARQPRPRPPPQPVASFDALERATCTASHGTLVRCARCEEEASEIRTVLQARAAQVGAVRSDRRKRRGMLRSKLRQRQRRRLEAPSGGSTLARGGRGGGGGADADEDDEEEENER